MKNTKRTDLGRANQGNNFIHMLWGYLIVQTLVPYPQNTKYLLDAAKVVRRLALLLQEQGPLCLRWRSVRRNALPTSVCVLRASSPRRNSGRMLGLSKRQRVECLRTEIPHRGLELEECALAIQAPTIADQATIGADHTMAGNN